MNEYLLIKARPSWADEITCQCFAIANKEEWEKYKLKVKEAFDAEPSKVMAYNYPRVNIGIGTNESLEYNNFAQWVKEFDEQVITKEDADTLCRLFDLEIDGCAYGVGSGIFDVLNYLV